MWPDLTANIQLSIQFQIFEILNNSEPLVGQNSGNAYIHFLDLEFGD